jgi:fructan beta-fructosidase
MKKQLRTLNWNIICIMLLLLGSSFTYAQHPLAQVIQAGEFDQNLTNFTSKSNGVITAVDANTFNLSNTDGDHFALYNGTQNFFKSFIFEADIELINGGSAALLIGIQDLNNPGSKWIGANFNKDESDLAIRVFDVGSGRGNLVMSAKPDNIDFNKKLRLSMEVSGNGDFTYSIRNSDGSTHSLQGNISNWTGGFFGLLTFKAEASFSNVRFTDHTNYSGTSIDNSAGSLSTNLSDLYYHSGTWAVTE